MGKIDYLEEGTMIRGDFNIRIGNEGSVGEEDEEKQGKKRASKDKT